MKTTTPIGDVPSACAARWAPYQVTKVPPDDILSQEHVPPAPPVKNMTNGAVSDATAEQWANASNRDSGWFQWGEANDQPVFLLHLVGPAVIGSPEEQAALASGGHILQPACNLYPRTESLFTVQQDGKSYFSRKRLPTDAAFVFVALYAGPCSQMIVQADGRSTTVQDFASPETVFLAGRYESDPVLGSIWFGDAGGNCVDPAGPPSEWCQR